MNPDSPPIHGRAVEAVVELLESQRLMTLGVNRPDGWPQVTTVGYVNDGLNLYFTIACDSQKLANIRSDPRVSIAIRSSATHGDAVGLSLAGHAAEVVDPELIERLNQKVIARYPDVRVYAPGGDSVAVIHVAPEIITPVSVADGRSHAQTYTVGPAARPMTFISPSEVSRLF